MTQERIKYATIKGLQYSIAAEGNKFVLLQNVRYEFQIVSQKFDTTHVLVNFRRLVYTFLDPRHHTQDF